MYKIKKEFEHQKVVCFLPNGTSIKLDTATQEELKKIYSIKGNEKFIEKANKSKKSK